MIRSEPDPDSPDATLDGVPCDHGRRRQAIVKAILDGICRGEYVAEQRLVVQRLADRLKVSPTPVREALVELQGIGILELHPNRGAIVRQVTRRDVSELYRIRRALECEAMRTAASRVPQDQLDTLAAELKRLLTLTSGSELAGGTRAADTRLHDLIAKYCGNRRLASEIGRHKLLFRAFRDLGYGRLERDGVYDRFAVENREHLEIVEALRAGDRREAVRAMARHLRSAIQFWSRNITLHAPFILPAEPSPTGLEPQTPA